MELQNGQYVIDGIVVEDLVKKYGSPIYVYDSSKMISQYQRMMDAFSGIDIKVHYACKALSNINVLKIFCKHGAGLDTVSIQEVEMGLLAGFNPNDILFTPNCVSMDEIDLTVAKGVKVNIDNISLLEQFGHKYGNSKPVSVRINPHIMAGGHEKISTGHIDSKFGISIYQMPHLLRVIEANNIHINGIHMHTGSDILDVEVFNRGAEILLETARNFKELEFIDLGSGFKVPYKPDDIETDIEQLGKSLSTTFKKFCKSYGKPLQLIFEPGKYLVSQAGYFLTTVNVIKQTTATVFAGVNSGLNHLIRPMFYDAYHHIVNISKPEGKTRIYTVVGYICETDTFGWNRKITEISEGDTLCFLNAGAYCFMMSSNYNSRLRPAEILIYEGKDYLIRKAEVFDDLLHNQVEIEL